MTLANEYWFNSSDAGFYPVTIDQSYKIYQELLHQMETEELLQLVFG